MADFGVYNNQVLFATFGAGIGLVFFIWLVYRALWRPRRMEREGEEVYIDSPSAFVRWLVKTIPWAIIIAVIVCVTYSILHIYHQVKQPPNV